MIGKDWFDTITHTNRVTGLEITLNTNGSTDITLVQLKKAKQNIITELTRADISSIDELIAIHEKSVPLCLLINGKGIIHKKIIYAETDSDKQLLNKVLPNANTDDFYIQRHAIITDLPEENYVSVIRRSIVDDILAKLNDTGFAVLKCNIGPFTLEDIYPFLDDYSNDIREIEIPYHRLSFENNAIKDYVFVPDKNILPQQSISVAGEFIKREYLVAYSIAFGYLLNNAASTKIDIPGVELLSKEYKEKAVFKFTGWCLLIGFLGILLINYFLFDHYWTKQKTFEARLSISKGMLNEYEKLKTETMERSAFFEKAGLLESSRISFFADKLAADIPADIQLTELNVYPMVVKSKLDDTKQMEFSAKKISVSGFCKRSSELNEWISIIKKKDWVKELNLLNYSYGKEEEIGSFKIDITLNK